MKKFILTLLISIAGLSVAHANTGGIAWDKFPVEKSTDVTALQNGARTFANYCLNCHNAAFMRYNRLRDIGLTDDQIKKNLMFATDKVGDVMKVSLDPKNASEWLGAVPPDLTLITRSRSAAGQGTGADYVYTFLRTFYRDETKATGWNNLAFPNIGMPHILWEWQGQRSAKFVEETDPHDETKKTHRFAGFEQITPGTKTPHEFDQAVGDLVAYLNWMAEPAQSTRTRLGVWVLLFLAVFTLIAWRLNAAFWKDIK
ncbi:MAG: cytochrome c1 [Burkholderiaceae bacterium]|nr:cytochrome c1 [Burkholderiaceae bacterium]